MDWLSGRARGQGVHAVATPALGCSCSAVETLGDALPNNPPEQRLPTHVEPAVGVHDPSPGAIGARGPLAHARQRGLHGLLRHRGGVARGLLVPARHQETLGKRGADVGGLPHLAQLAQQRRDLAVNLQQLQVGHPAQPSLRV